MANYEWLKSQLPESLSWGQKPITMQPEIPDDVQAVFVRLQRVDPENRDKIIRICSVDAAMPPRKKTLKLSGIPKGPTKIFPAGTYTIEWTINNKNGSSISHGSKVYRGLEKAPQ